jgi:hypothetical protein
MMPRLLELVWLIALREDRGTSHSGTRMGCVQTIDGMLYVGLGPARHRAA